MLVRAGCRTLPLLLPPPPCRVSVLKRLACRQDDGSRIIFLFIFFAHAVTVDWGRRSSPAHSNPTSALGGGVKWPSGRSLIMIPIQSNYYLSRGPRCCPPPRGLLRSSTRLSKLYTCCTLPRRGFQCFSFSPYTSSLPLGHFDRSRNN